MFFVPKAPSIEKVAVASLLSANTIAIVPTLLTATEPDHEDANAEPPLTRYRSPLQPPPLSAQLEATYQVGLRAPSLHFIRSRWGSTKGR